MRNLNCDYLPTILITYQSIDQSISWVLCDCSLWRVSLFWVQFFEDSDRLIKLTVVNEADDHRQRMKVRSRGSRLQNHAGLLSLNHISSTWLTVLSSPLASPRSAGLAGGRGLVLVLCDLRQQDRVSLAAGEEDRPPAAGLNPGTPADTGERFCTDTRGRRFQ